MHLVRQARREFARIPLLGRYGNAAREDVSITVGLVGHLQIPDSVAGRASTSDVEDGLDGVGRDVRNGHPGSGAASILQGDVHTGGVDADPCPSVGPDGRGGLCPFGKIMTYLYAGGIFAMQTVGAVQLGMGLRRKFGSSNGQSSNTIQQPSLPGGISVSSSPDGLRLSFNGTW